MIAMLILGGSVALMNVCANALAASSLILCFGGLSFWSATRIPNPAYATNDNSAYQYIDCVLDRWTAVSSGRIRFLSTNVDRDLSDVGANRHSDIMYRDRCLARVAWPLQSQLPIEKREPNLDCPSY